ncbi:MAG: hypothetical protein ACF8PN_12385 [Phycisphaerales bacterium]
MSVAGRSSSAGSGVVTLQLEFPMPIAVNLWSAIGTLRRHLATP